MSQKVTRMRPQRIQLASSIYPYEGGAEKLLNIMRWCRGYGSNTEKAFLKSFIDKTHPAMVTDEVGNRLLHIEGLGQEIMWSCHTDSVHSSKREGMHAISITNGIARLGSKSLSTSNCLGADDGVGIFLMMEMIAANKPGLYVFHRGEEVGGIGSKYLSSIYSNYFSQIKAAIALDRKGYSDVITHQAFSRCASDDFANSLAAQLHPYIATYKPSDKGVYTDTAEYVDCIGECTNLSVGYFNEHSSQECVDLGFVMRLRQALLNLDPVQLVFKRKPGELEMDVGWTRMYSHANDPLPDVPDPRKYEKLVKEYPDVAALLMRDSGILLSDLQEAIYDATGQLCL